MKNIWSKNLLIIGLLITNLLSAGLVATNGKRLRALYNHITASKGSNKRVPAAIAGHAEVSGPNVSFRNDDEMQACYQSYLSRQPDVEEGAVVVHWQIGDDGNVQSIQLIHSDLQDESFTGCILNRIRNEHFQASRAGVLVAHKFNFKRRDPTDLRF